MAQESNDRRDRYHAFQRQYRANRVRFLALRQHYCLIECAWCQRHIRWQRKERAVPCETSHSICLPCFAVITQRESTEPWRR